MGEGIKQMCGRWKESRKLPVVADKKEWVDKKAQNMQEGLQCRTGLVSHGLRISRGVRSHRCFRGRWQVAGRAGGSGGEGGGRRRQGAAEMEGLTGSVSGT